MAKKGPKKNSKVGKNKAIIRGEKRITATFLAPQAKIFIVKEKLKRAPKRRKLVSIRPRKLQRTPTIFDLLAIFHFGKESAPS